MKCFNIIFLIFSVSLGVICVSSRNIDSIVPQCDIEQRELIREYDICAPKQFQITEIIDNIKQFRDRTINGTEFSRIITNYCVTLKNASSCSMGKATKISVACRDKVKIQGLLNLMRIINEAADDLCSEEIIVAVAGDKGFSCLDSGELTQCAHGKMPNQEDVLQDNKICQTTQFLHTCNNELFDACENDGILKKFVTQLLKGISQDFSCD